MSLVIIEYVWIDGVQGLRSKTKVMSYTNTSTRLSLEDVPEWNFDGSSTQQAQGKYSEVILRPVRLFKDPFRDTYNSYMVLCETYNPDGTPAEANNRHEAKRLFDQKEETEPWFGLECEFFLMKDAGSYQSNTPIATNKHGLQAIQGQYYCGVGTKNVFGREVIEEIMQKCIKAGINITGINCEVGPSQWEYQIGICTGIESGDHVWMSKYIAERVSEMHNVQICWHPKPIDNFNGSGCHTNFSTKEMREKDSMEYLEQVMTKLEAKHDEHMEVYGSDNHLRMTGKHETSSYDKFTWGRGDRTASFRVPTSTCTYIEDRRPASNIDPYLVTSKIYETVVLD